MPPGTHATCQFHVISTDEINIRITCLVSYPDEPFLTTSNRDVFQSKHRVKLSANIYLRECISLQNLNSDSWVCDSAGFSIKFYKFLELSILAES